ncbi:hypothetical protein [Hymenobacter sp. HDW8]|uniref:hypothetical protein n=1 Tax=Hymenobacter sp. HDW8 TaxID=2714932 RepID=UPI00140E83A6|nr:hypothetical protein [Hymenobacter sp. HDW8]QIL78134.1 hypothetical protein G7064_20085 [Hymenobacter sp. HDW8]
MRPGFENPIHFQQLPTSHQILRDSLQLLALLLAYSAKAQQAGSGQQNGVRLNGKALPHDHFDCRSQFFLGHESELPGDRRQP